MAIGALIGAAEKTGFRRLVSRVSPENATGRKLLVSVGFRKAGTYEKHACLDGGWRNVVIVGRPISANLFESRVEL